MSNTPVRRGLSLSLRPVAVAIAVLSAAFVPAAITASPASAATATPLIVDTDIFSDADDAGALATAFALQAKGEANVLAVTINTNLDRGKVEANSYKCAEAIAQFYGRSPAFGSDTIGAPNNGQVSPFTAQCAAKAKSGFSTPGNAVDTIRTALQSQPNGSVVIAETGYATNLSDLIASPSDKALVAQKVKALVIMSGAYPTGNHENNSAGNATATKDVADNWPTKVVWSGAEIGDVVRSGGNISSTHPTSSPVRASYEAFRTAVGSGPAINSWDLTAVFHAIRSDWVSETGPGKNSVAVDDPNWGNNTFTAGPGNQYYLTLTSKAGFEGALDSLLDDAGTWPSTTPAGTTALNGYRVVTSSGAVRVFGENVRSYGDLAGRPLNASIIGASRTSSGNGYWLLGRDGGIFSFGDAAFFGSMGGKSLNAPIVSMAPTSTGNGYWLVASDGGIFSFGDATFFGSMGGKRLAAPIVGMTPTKTGNGYWLVASDGGIFAYGDAGFYESMGGKRLNAPIVGMTRSATGGGYRMVATDGGIFAFGDALFYGSMGGKSLNQPIVGMQATSSGSGYWFVASDGGVFSFGDAPFVGSAANLGLSAPVVALA